MATNQKLKAATKQEVANTLKSVDRKEIPVLPIDPKTFTVSKDLRYVPYYKPGVDGKGIEFDLFEAHSNAISKLGLIHKLPICMIGPTGVGKTLAIAAYHSMTGDPLLQADCSEGTKKSDLIGRFVILDGTVWYQLGILPTGIVVANTTESGKAGIDLEEVNGLRQEMQKIVNQFLDWRGHVYIPELQKIYTLEPGKSLMIYATMNPSTYGGTHELNKDFEDRYTPIKVPYPSSEQEFEILEHDGVPENIVRSLIQLGMELRASEAAGDLDRSPSPRTNQMFCDAYRVYDGSEKLKDRALPLALTHVILNKFQSPKQAETVAGRMQRVFGVNVNANTMDDD